jgi:hypothetical protein
MVVPKEFSRDSWQWGKRQTFLDIRYWKRRILHRHLVFPVTCERYQFMCKPYHTVRRERHTRCTHKMCVCFATSEAENNFCVAKVRPHKVGSKSPTPSSGLLCLETLLRVVAKCTFRKIYRLGVLLL